MLKTQVDHSYNNHPEFQFGKSWRSPDPAAMAAFDAAYRSASDRIGDRVAARNTCRRSAMQVFEALRSQADDDSQRTFVDELQRESLRLIDEEFDHFSKQAASAELGSAPTRAIASAMARERHAFGRLDSASVSEMLAVSASALTSLRANAIGGKLTRDELSCNSGPVVVRLCSILNREFKLLGVLDGVSSYIRRPMRVTGLALEISVPQARWWRNGFGRLPRAPHTLYAHLDESAAYPKSIVYLSDVGPDSGPTGCYPGAYEDLTLCSLTEIIGRVIGNVGSRADSPLHALYAKAYHQSMTSEHFRRHFMLLPSDLRFNSHLGWDILPGSEAEAELAGREIRMTGPSGSFIVFDGAHLLHRGGLVQSGERIALQVIFSEQSLWRRAARKLKYALPWA
jgi:hypothetical protein